jgi:hypothetical protein
MYCLCVNVYCHRVSIQLQLTNISIYQYQYVIKKDEVFPVHPIKACRGSRSWAPFILNFSTRWAEWSASRSARFKPRTEHFYLSNRRMGGPQIRSGRTGGQGTVLSLLREPGRGSYIGDFGRWIKDGSGNGASLCLWELYEGNLEGGLRYWGPRKLCQVRHWKCASVSIGATVFYFFCEKFRRHVKEIQETCKRNSGDM